MCIVNLAFRLRIPTAPTQLSLSGYANCYVSVIILPKIFVVLRFSSYINRYSDKAIKAVARQTLRIGTLGLGICLQKYFMISKII